MKLAYSEPKKIPYIDFGDNNRLIFSTITEDNELGFFWFAFSGNVKTSVRLSKKGRTFVNGHKISFMTTMNLTSIPKEAKRGILTNTTLKKLKSILKPLVVDGYFPRKNLKKLEMELNDEVEFSPEDLMDDDPTATESYDDIEENPKKKRKIKLKPKRKIKLKPKRKIKLKPKRKVKLKG